MCQLSWKQRPYKQRAPEALCSIEMSQAGDSYVSVFKIDGIPILPPVIDDDRRIELSHDRQLAMEVERRLRLRREQKFEVSSTELAASDIDETLVKGVVECSVSNYDTSAAVDSLLDDNISTLKDDIVGKMNEAVEATSTIETANEEEAMVQELQSDRKSLNIVPLSLTIDANLNTFNTDMISPSFSLHSSPSLGALDESRNQSLYFTPMSGRESFSPLPNGQLSGARLIRSNSYTIEKPSPMLLQHMQANGINPGSNCSPLRNPMSLNEFRKNRNNQMNTPRKLLQSFNAVDSPEVKEQKAKNNPTKTSARKLMSQNSNASLNTTVVLSTQYSVKTSSPMAMKTTKTTKSATKQKPTNQSGVFKNRESILRSIYGTGKPSKVQVSAKKDNSTSTSLNSVKVSQNKTVNKSQVIETASTRPMNGANDNITPQNYQDILVMIENQHANQMKVLLQRQQEEQKRMQEEFFRQQEELLKKISDLVINRNEKQITPKATTETQPVVEAKKSNEKMLIEEVNNEVPVVFDTNGNRVNRFTPDSSKCIRRLYYDDKKLIADDLNKSYPSSLSTVSSEPFEMYTIEEVRAASIITAYTRGYLTRRLFKSTKVQNIVKTIRDTLLFILDLHYEGNENESPADIELKSHLIQQLASASQNLHSIFVKIPMVERMDIIAKDREWQQFKMNRSKSSDNNKNHMFVNGNSHLARSQSARFEKKF
ncbi:centriolar coiled-coil protein of 110 kDa isoform X2 [Sitodiplosis mosellana]|uniref:centriolar coiled-coil protein of 110 kDa isoform X2 n=1 Tax=Sitodiplosis mosellana TaxID=263140 RepID=UPI002443B983|nr:centriolar coiled-coil protein of 110 kDa isoform X2 [Sitodiplosis mosellana]